MLAALVFLIVLVVVSVYYLFSRETRIQKLLRNIPGPKPLFLLGNGLDLYDLTEVLNTYVRCRKEYGNLFKVTVGPSRMFVVGVSHKFFEFFLNSTSVLNKSLEYRFLCNWLGTGLLTADKIKWKKRRRIITPAFHFKIIEQFVTSFESKGDIFIKKLKAEVGKPTFNIHKYIDFLTLDIICETAMGTCVHAQENSDNPYVRAVKDMGNLAMERMLSPIKMYDLLYVLTPSYYREKECKRIMRSYTESVIVNRIEQLKNEPPIVIDDNECTGLKNKTAFLDLLLYSKIDGEPLSKEDIREEVDTFMFEGHDTTSSAISFVLYLLSQYPEAQNKVLEEQKTILGNDLSRPVTYNDLLNMKYLEMVIKESLRLYPSGSIIARELQEDVEFEGHILPKGVAIVMPIYVMHRNEEYFPNPNEFIPERFIDADFRKVSQFVYVPFSAGPRNCIGQKFAMFEIKSIVSKMVRNYQVLPATPHVEPILSAETVLKSKNGIYIALKEREDKT